MTYDKNKKLRMYAVTEDNVTEFRKEIDDIVTILKDLGEEDAIHLAKRLDDAYDEAFKLNMHIDFKSGLNFDILSDVGEHIGQGSINKEEMEASELEPDMEYWNRKI